MKRLLLVFILLLPSITLDGQARGFGFIGTHVTPSVDHPRLMITLSGLSPTVSELQTRLGTGGPQATLFQGFLNIYCNTVAHGGNLNTSPPDDDMAIWIYGFILTTYPVTGANYNDCINDTGLRTRFITSFDTIISGGGCGCTRDVTTIAIAYDWGNNYLTGTRGGASVDRKHEAVAFIQANATDPGNSVNLWGHSDNAARGKLLYTWAGYVYSGDGIDDADATARIAKRSTYYISNTGVQTAGNLTSGIYGSYPEGLGYWMSEWQQGIGWMQFLYADSYRTSQSSTTPFTSGVNKFLEYFPTYMVWQFSPYIPNDASGCGTCIRFIKTPESDDRGSDITFPDTTQQYASLLPNFVRAYASTNSIQASLAKWIYTNLFWASGYVTQTTSVVSARWALMANYLGYNTVTAVSPASLNMNLANQFDEGYVIIKDNWVFDGTSSWVRFTAEPYDWGATLGFGQTCTGGFDIHRRGPLAITPGAGAHSIIQESGWGCNTIIFPKPTETRSGRSYWDKGGMRPQTNFSTTNNLSSLVVGSQWDIGGLKSNTSRVDLTPGTHSSPSTTHSYSYVYTDLSRAYNGTQNIDGENSSKISNFERQVVRFPPTTPGITPGFTITYDRVTTTGTDVEPRYQMWPAANTTNTTKTMTINGATSTDTVTRNGIASTRYIGTCGTMTGTIAYTGVWSMSAKAFWTPLLPSSCYIIERGGPNTMGQMGQTDSHEMEDPYGYQGGCWQSETAGSCGSLSSSGDRPFEGSYRYELLHQVTSTNEPFLNVIEDVEYATVSASAKITLSGTNTTGVRIDAASPRCSIFKTTSGSLTTGDFELAGAATYDCLISDLPASTSITFTKGSNIGTVTLISSGSTSLTYTSTAQGTLWFRIVVSGAGTGVSNRISW